MQKILEYLKEPGKFLLFFDRNKIIRLSDKTYIKLVYKAITGEKLNLEEPITFNEKLQWLKLYNRKPEYTMMVDKYEVKKYVAEKIGEQHIIPTLGVYDKFEDIDFEKLPNEFVLKCTHDSGGNVICKDKTKLDIKAAKEKISKSLKTNYFYIGREWPYKNVKPRIIAEKYMVDESGIELKDYKVFCFNGEPKFIQVDIGRFSNHKRNFYSLEWELMDLEIAYPNEKVEKIEKPINLKDMLEYAKILSKDIPHIRVDFYSIKQEIYFGEITFFHEAGFGNIKPKEYNKKLGDMIKLPKE